MRSANMYPSLACASVIAVIATGLCGCDSQQVEPCCGAPRIANTLPDSVILYTYEERSRLDLSPHIEHTGGHSLALEMWHDGTSATVSMDGAFLTLVPVHVGITEVFIRAHDDMGNTREDSIAIDVRVPAYEPFDFFPFREGVEWVYEHHTGDSDEYGRWVQEDTVTVQVENVTLTERVAHMVLSFEVTGRKGSTSWERDSLEWRPIHYTTERTLTVTANFIRYPLYVSHLPFDDFPRTTIEIPRYPEVVGDTLVIDGSTPYKEGSYKIVLVRDLGIVQERSLGCYPVVIPPCWGGDARLLSFHAMAD